MQNLKKWPRTPQKVASQALLQLVQREKNDSQTLPLHPMGEKLAAQFQQVGYAQPKRHLAMRPSRLRQRKAASSGASVPDECAQKGLARLRALLFCQERSPWKKGAK